MGTNQAPGTHAAKHSSRGDSKWGVCLLSLRETGHCLLRRLVHPEIDSTSNHIASHMKLEAGVESEKSVTSKYLACCSYGGDTTNILLWSHTTDGRTAMIAIQAGHEDRCLGRILCDFNRTFQAMNIE
jgi:hypothetical protein